MKQNQRLDASEPHFEIIDTATKEVWQSIEAVDAEAFAAMEPPPGFAKVGVGVGAMDLHYFRRSPGTEEEGPVRTAEFGGFGCFLCARPVGAPELPAGPSGPRKMLVDKHHTLVYRAGREIGWLRLPDGSRFVHVVDGGATKAPLELPEGWSLDSERLDEEWILDLPHPTTAFFFPNGDSYQGPVPRP